MVHFLSATVVCFAAALDIRHWPVSFLSCRAFFACSLAASFRSDCWFLAYSYTRRDARCSSGALLGLGAFLGFSFLGLGFLTILGFFLGSGLDMSKRSWKVLSSVRGWGADPYPYFASFGLCGSSPRLRGGLRKTEVLLEDLGFIPAPAGRTRIPTSRPLAFAVHPRGCRVGPSSWLGRRPCGGSSLRVRGRGIQIQ